MDPVVAAAWIELIPAIVALLLITLFVVLNRPRIARLLDRVSKVGVAGVFEIELATEQLKHARPATPVTDQQATALERRVARAADVLAKARLLWVDDQPAGNRGERVYLRSAGITVINALSTDEGMTLLDRFDFDVVITDMVRPDSTTAGLDLAERMRHVGHQQPVVAYVRQVDPGKPLPIEFAGLTNRPAELVNLVLDALERDLLQ